ncbi:MAG: Ig-like domain-containing protein [Christensenellales bacterium]|jgi:hypothetical protein
MHINERLRLSGSPEERTVAFSVETNGVYAVSLFGCVGAEGTLYDSEGNIVESGVSTSDGRLLSARLSADSAYRLTLKNAVRECTLEIMRDALGRSFYHPIALQDGYVKAIVGAHEAHWYAYTAKESGIHTIKTESSMDTLGWIVGKNGDTIAENDDALAPYEDDCLLRAQLDKGQTYLVRICAKEKTTGAYKIRLTVPDGASERAEMLSLSRTEATLDTGETIRLSAVVSPEGAHGDLTWITTNPAVVVVSSEGVATAVGAGEADIIALAYGIEERAHIIVRYVKVSDIELLSGEAMEIAMGETKRIAAKVLPENASDTRLTYTSSDASVVTADREGALRGIREGTATVTVTDADGGVQKKVDILVTKPKPRFRALAVGIQKYDDGRERIGATNTTQGVYDMLKSQPFDGAAANTTMRIDSTRGDFLALLQKLFSPAESTDISVLYINCHGGMAAGETYIEFRDGKRLTARQLERELRKIRGRVVLLLDCCQSGAVISKDTVARFGGNIQQILSGGERYASSKYTVIASASSEEDSYRIGYEGEVGENGIATVFARSLCEGAGWNLIKDRAMTMCADRNRDGLVRAGEMALFVKSRVKWYLEETEAMQNVQMIPANSRLALFQKRRMPEE